MVFFQETENCTKRCKEMLVCAKIPPQIVDLELCPKISNFYMQIFLTKMQIINFSF